MALRNYLWRTDVDINWFPTAWYFAGNQRSSSYFGDFAFSKQYGAVLPLPFYFPFTVIEAISIALAAADDFGKGSHRSSHRCRAFIFQEVLKTKLPHGRDAVGQKDS